MNHLRQTVGVLAALPFLLAATPKPQVWHEVKSLKAGFSLSVPVFPPKLERALHMEENSSSIRQEGQTMRVRIWNYGPGELLDGEVPSLRKGQFWIEVEIGPLPTTKGPWDQELRKDCVGKVIPLVRHGSGAWCKFDPNRWEGEASMTHIGWVRVNHTLYHLWMNARGLEPEVPKRIFETFAASLSRPSARKG